MAYLRRVPLLFLYVLAGDCYGSRLKRSKGEVVKVKESLLYLYRLNN